MIIKTTAIALRINPFSRTSRVITWLTPDYGRIVTAIKGACRAKSAFLGQYDLAMRCELLFYRRERDGLHIARECTPLAWRAPLRDNWRGAVAASYLCELVSRATMSMLDAQATFDLLEQTLEALGQGTLPEPAILRFEFALLHTLGLAPNFAFCDDCSATAGIRPCRFSLPNGRLRCIHSRSHLPGDTSVAVDAALLDALCVWQRLGQQPGDVAIPVAAAAAMLAVRRFLGMFLQCHLDLPMASRQAAFAWLDARPGEARAMKQRPAV